MDRELAAQARLHDGLLSSADLGGHPARFARQVGLVPVQPRVWIAATQPVQAPEQVAAVRMSARGPYALLDVTALWKYGLMSEPEVVRVGVRHGTRLRARPPTQVRRLAPHLLEGCRVVDGTSVVALEVALVQAAALLEADARVALFERVLRERRTTIPRVRARCRRGVSGSAATRSVLDELLGVSLDSAVRILCAQLAARGVTGLRTEVRFVNAAGCSAYADVLDEAASTVLEVDGFLSHLERQRFRADRRRDRWMHAEHEIVTLRIDAAEVADDLAALADELAQFLLQRRQSAQRSTG